MNKNRIEAVGSWTGDLQFCQNWIDAVTTHSNSTPCLEEDEEEEAGIFFFNFEFTGWQYLLNKKGKYLMTSVCHCHVGN